MELKQMWEAAKSMHGTLLIVPYGIETYYHDTPVLVLGLLIVPYGIET